MSIGRVVTFFYLVILTAAAVDFIVDVWFLSVDCGEIRINSLLTELWSGNVEKDNEHFAIKLFNSDNKTLSNSSS